jgi:hypothetical protein
MFWERSRNLHVLRGLSPFFASFEFSAAKFSDKGTAIAVPQLLTFVLFV